MPALGIIMKKAPKGLSILLLLLFVSWLGFKYFCRTHDDGADIPREGQNQTVDLSNTLTLEISKEAKSIKEVAGVIFFPDDKDRCFCQLQGAIDDCTCQIDAVDKYNNYKIYPRLRSLLSKDYFRYYQTNLKKECPFWADDSKCALEYCQVQECREDEVPQGLKGERSLVRDFKKIINPPEQLIPVAVDAQKPCAKDLGYINTTISEESQEGFERWKAHDNSLVDFCSVREDDVDTQLQYVDLLLNPERFTGYGGSSAHRVWGSIYQENCFKETSETNVMAPFKTEALDESCIEKRTFYRAISGLHASINIHLSAKYLLTDTKTSALFKPKPGMDWGPNLTEFRQHFDSSLTQGQSPAWLKNLYFLYLLELKAIWKLSQFLRSFDLYTGNSEEDIDVKNVIVDLLGVVEAFPSHFEEKALFSREDALKLKTEFHQRFTNITRIMDCVGCQKCKLWGKLQIKGLGTALKILFSKPIQPKQVADFVTRNEIVALINAFGRLSESIYELENFRSLIKEEGSSSAESNTFAMGIPSPPTIKNRRLFGDF